MSDTTGTPSPQSNPKSRGWLIFEGIVFILIGILAITFPMIMTLAIEQVLGIFAIIGGVFAAGGVVFGKYSGHRFSAVLSGILLILLGLALLIWVPQGVFVLTVLLAAFFFVEGIFSIIGAIQNRKTLNGWPILLINGIVALVLGGLIYFGLPSTAPWAIGLLYGINMVFTGGSFLTLAFLMPKS